MEASDDQQQTGEGEREERQRLADVLQRLEHALQTMDARLNDYAREVREQKEYLWQSRTDMDHVEKVASRESIERAARTGEVTRKRRDQLNKLRASPYFGRFDFAPDGGDARPIYIGIHHFHDDDAGEDVVYDWRAPIAGLFYDYETGPARYSSPDGEVRGEIERKRQFRIKKGQMELMLESSVNVVDDVLQEELSRTSDEGMKNIVATIQRDQNAIIRNDEAPTLVIQGAAGSGKTSIALHRIAFLLYRFKDSLSSRDILIISPNRVFADYISNVLPELGEESVNEIGMETLADELLDGQYRFQTFFEQTTELLEKNNETMKERLQFKASPEFLKKLGEYADHVEDNRFEASDLWIARRLVPGWLLDELFRKHRSLGLRERIKQVAHETEQKIGIQYNYDLSPEERKTLHEAIGSRVHHATLRQHYKAFFDWLERPELFKTAKRGRLEYADVFPLIYLRMRLEGVSSCWSHVKHLLIDEMQDYTPVQYAVIAQLFNCRMTILGDGHQSVNPYSGSSSEEIRQAFQSALRVTLNKSFRSSYEIARFAQRIQPNPDLEIIERHGKEPEVIRCKNRTEENETLGIQAQQFNESDYNTLGVICKTQKQASQLYDFLSEHFRNLYLLSEDSRTFRAGIVICTAHMAKGLEFDQVIVPHATDRNYHNSMDRNLLYVACTRAMHKLTLTHTGQPSGFIEAE